MTDYQSISQLLKAGQASEAAQTIAGLSPAGRSGLAAHLAATADRGDVLALMDELLYGPNFPAALGESEKLRRAEALRLLAADLATIAACGGWREAAGALRVIAVDPLYRVREASVRLVAAMASAAFEESRGFWEECLLDGDGALAAAVLRGLAASSVAAPKALDLFALVIRDIRKDVRHALGPRALSELGLKEPQTVFARLWEWAREGDEMTRWNVAQSLSTPLGGVYAEQSMEIIEILAADERSSVRHAAAAAAVQIAQRRPAFALPILARWRSDEPRAACAKLALEALARR